MENTNNKFWSNLVKRSLQMLGRLGFVGYLYAIELRLGVLSLPDPIINTICSLGLIVFTTYPGIMIIYETYLRYWVKK